MDTKILDKIRNILSRTTENGCTEGEAEAAARKARALMDENGVSLEDLQLSDYVEGDGGTYGKWTYDNDFAFNLLSHYDVQCVLNPIGTKRQLVIFGAAPVVERAKFVYRQLLTNFRSYWFDYARKTGAEKSKRKSFIGGVAFGFQTKLVEEMIRGANRNDGIPLQNNAIVARTLAQKTQDAFSERYASKEIVRSTKDNSPTDAVAFREGFLKGYTMNISRELDGGQRCLSD